MTTCPVRSCWIFDRVDRLSDLIDRAQESETFLLREACDVPAHSAAWNALQARVAVVRRRIAGMCQCRRQARREAFRTA